MLPEVGSVRSTVPPVLRESVGEVMVNVEMAPFDVSAMNKAPELIARLATVWLLPAAAPLMAKVPPPRANAVALDKRLLDGEFAAVKSSVNFPLPIFESVPPPVSRPPLMVVLPEPVNVTAFPAVFMPPVSDN